jgi:hypothetical protein
MLTYSRQWHPMRRHVTGGAACVLDVSPTAVELLFEHDRHQPGVDPI